MRIVIEAVFIPEVRINQVGGDAVSHRATGIADEWKTWMETYGRNAGVVVRVIDGPNGERGSLVQKEVWS